MIAPPNPSQPWSAYLRTGQGQVVRTPHHIGPCPNCGLPARSNLVTPAQTGGRLTLVLDIVCEGGCGVDEEVQVVLRPVAREVA